MKRLLLASTATVAVVAALGCQKAPRSPASTLSSPSAVAATAWCAVLDGDVLRAEPLDDCDAALTYHRVVVANRGNREAHILEVDERTPALLDTDEGTPGINGLPVGDGPRAAAALGTPGVVVIGSEREPSLALVDAAFRRLIPISADGGPATSVLALPSPPLVLRAVPSSNTLVWASAGGALHSGDFAVECDGEAVLSSACAPTATLSNRRVLALPGEVSGLAVAVDGTAWVSLEGTSRVLAVAVAGAALEQACQGTPCVITEISVAGPCADGLDNDGDGHTDHADPQCFASAGREDGTLWDGRIEACGDGADNDGDGLHDADDPGCLGPEDVNEDERDVGDCADGADNDLDGSADSDDADCIEGSGENSAQSRPTAIASARCADGLDNDGDGFTDATGDSDCYGATTDSEATPAIVLAGDLALTAEGDLLLVVDRTSPQLIVFDAETGDRIDVNGADRLRTGTGMFIPQRFPTRVVTDTLDVFTTTTDDGSTITVRDRVAHVFTTGGLAYTFDLDRLWSVTDSSSVVTFEQTDPLFRRRDASSAVAEVRGVNCSFPSTAFEELGVLNLQCGDAILPALAVIDDEEANEADVSWVGQPGLALVSLPERDTFTLADDGNSLEPTRAPDEYRIAADTWEITWEGVLPGTDREDGLLNGARLDTLGAEPCLTGVDVCTFGIDLTECPDLADLCDTGLDVCAAGLDVCAICPAACEGAADFCAAGVIAGDRVELEPPRYLPDADGRCVISDANLLSAAATERRWEFEVVGVDATGLELAPVPEDGGAVPYATAVPELACWGEPVPFTVRAGRSWVLVGADTFGHPSPLRSAGEACVPRDDAALRVGRPSSGSLFTTEYGMSFELVDGTAETVRDYRIEFDVISGFANRETRASQFILGPSTRDAVVTDTLRGRRVVTVDDAQDFAWVYSATSFTAIGNPIP